MFKGTELEKARKQAWFASISALITGVATLLVMGIAYMRFGAFLDRYAAQQAASNPSAVHVVKAVKSLGLGLPSALGLMLLGPGSATISFLRKQRSAEKQPSVPAAQ